MSTVTGADGVSVLAQYQQKDETKKQGTGDEIQDRFMTLLVAQMRNQDPLNPMDNAEITSQLAQLNTVKGIDDLNHTLNGLVDRVQASQALAGIGAVGRFAMIGGERISLYDGQAVAGFELPADADQLKVTIYDSSGLVMHAAELGAHEAGLHTFVWDGVTDSGQSAVNGNYRFEIEAVSAGHAVGAVPLTVARVDAVLPNQGEPMFEIGGLPPVRLSEIRQFL